jgi:hypothetical protein
MPDAPAPPVSSPAPAPDGSGSSAAGVARGVSVAVINWNGEAYLVECLESVRALRFPVAEVILVDNGSFDRSLAIVRERFPEVRIVELGQNHGPCVARNVGVAEAKCGLVFAIDNDVVLEPDCLARLVEAYDRWGEPAVLQARSLLHGRRDTVHYDGGSVHYLGLVSLRNFYRPLAECSSDEEPIDCAISLALLVDARRLREAGGYDSSYFILFEDFDLSLRLRTRGERIVSVPSAMVYHREGTRGISFRGETSYPRMRAFYHSRNRWLLILKYYQAWTIVVFLPAILVYEVVWFTFCLLQRTPWEYFRGKISLLSILPAVLRSRGRIQRERVVPDREILRAGALSFWPTLVQSRARRAAKRALEAFFGGYFRLVRPLV